MEFSWKVFLVVWVVNTLYMAFMFFLQAINKSLPPRGSLIRGTKQKFLYVQDFHSCTWGDFLGLPLIYNAFVLLVMADKISEWQWVAFILVAILDGGYFLWMCLGENHKPDQGYPQVGVVSWHGLSHIPYHGVGVAVSVLTLYHVVILNIQGWPLVLGLIGAAIYIASFVADIKSGNFDPLKREPTGHRCHCVTPCKECRCRGRQGASSCEK